MKTLFIPIFLLLAIVAQSQVTGTVQDTSGALLPGATVSLLRAKDSSVIKLAVSANSGTYSFNQIIPGNYLIKASFSGFLPAYSTIIECKDSTFRVAPLILAQEEARLKNIIVTIQKPLIELKGDKMVMNVEGTINAIGSDLLDLLRKSPGVFVDKDDKISMNGKNGVQVYIDGKQSPLSGQDLSNYLKSLQSSQVATIEFITNPSAKFEAAGNAGIINIRLIKNQSIGLNGSVNTGYNIGTYGKFNSGFSLNYRNEKVNLFGTYGINSSKNYSNLDIFRNLRDSIYATKTTTTMQNEGQNFKTGLDYSINKNNIAGIVITGNLADGNMKNHSNTTVSNKTKTQDDDLAEASTQSHLTNNNVNYNVNYNFSNPKGESLLVNADYGTFKSGKRQKQISSLFNSNNPDKKIFEIASPGDIRIASGKVDWEQNAGKGKLSAGIKISFVKSDNDYKYYNVNDAKPGIDNEKSNHFLYKENIQAGYINYNKEIHGIILQAGLRAENTISIGSSSNDISIGEKNEPIIKKAFTDLFPSATIKFNIKPENQVSINYSRRIDRPSYQQLNPFKFNLDEYTIMSGNTHLRPQYTNGFGLTYIYKYKLNASINYSHVKDMISQIIDTATNGKVLFSSGNIAQQDVWSASISYPFQYKTFSLYANINTNYSNYKSKYGNESQKSIDAFSLMTVMQASLVLQKKWTAQFTGFYSAPTIYQGSMNAKSLWSVDAGIQRQFLNKKMTIKVSVSDIFNSLQFDGYSEFADLRTNFHSTWESRQFKLSLNYRFGRTGVKPARQAKSGVEDENKRAKSSADGLSVGQ